MPVGSRLKFLAHRQEHIFGECRTGKLDGDRQAAGEAAGQRERGDAGQIARGKQRAEAEICGRGGLGARAIGRGGDRDSVTTKRQRKGQHSSRGPLL